VPRPTARSAAFRPLIRIARKRRQRHRAPLPPPRPDCARCSAQNRRSRSSSRRGVVGARSLSLARDGRMRSLRPAGASGSWRPAAELQECTVRPQEQQGRM